MKLKILVSCLIILNEGIVIAAENSISQSKNCSLFENFDWIAVATFLGLLGGAISWVYNENQKRHLKMISEKEARYEKLLRNVKYLGTAFDDADKANEFITELHLCWMYCPDEIIQKGNMLLNSMNKKMGVEITQENIDMCKGELFLAIRKDLMKMRSSLMTNDEILTELGPLDFKDVVYNNNKITL